MKYFVPVLLLAGLLILSPARASTPPVSFAADLAPEVEGTDWRGLVDLTLESDGTVSFAFGVTNVPNVTSAHLHLAPPGLDGPVIFTLFDGPTVEGPFSGALSEGAIGQLEGPLAGRPVSDLMEQLSSGQVYANVHTSEYPGGVLRGQFGPAQAAVTVEATAEPETVQPQASPAPVETATPQPEASPTAEETLATQPEGNPTGEVAPTAQPEASPTPEETAAVQPEASPTNEATPAAQLTPEETAAAQPEAGPIPEETATAELQPDSTPQPTATVEPGATHGPDGSVPTKTGKAKTPTSQPTAKSPAAVKKQKATNLWFGPYPGYRPYPGYTPFRYPFCAPYAPFGPWTPFGSPFGPRWGPGGFGWRPW